MIYKGCRGLAGEVTSASRERHLLARLCVLIFWLPKVGGDFSESLMKLKCVMLKIECNIYFKKSCIARLFVSVFKNVTILI